MSDQLPKMDFVVHCGDCRHEWLVAVIPISLQRFCDKLEASVKAGCPKCDSRHVLCGKPGQEKSDATHS